MSRVKRQQRAVGLAQEVELLLAAFDAHLAEIHSSRLDRTRNAFQENGFAKAEYLAPASVKAGLGDEAEALVTAHGVRRDLAFAETDGTPRRMCNVRRHEIHRHGALVPAAYSCTALRQVLSIITGEVVVECPYEPEQYVITELSGRGDTHGWHWDDYSLALVWVIDCPPLADGGFVQCVPHTIWNKDDPQLHRQFIEHPILSTELLPGDLYVMRTNTVLHRVYPIQAGRRLIINMAYALPGDLGKEPSHETMDGLWDGGPVSGRKHT